MTKKRMLLLLIVVLLGTMTHLPVAVAEQVPANPNGEYQTISTMLADFEVPSKLWYDITLNNNENVVVTVYGDENVYLNISISPAFASMDQTEAFWNGAFDSDHIIVYNWDLPDGEPVISSMMNENTHAFTHSYSNIFVYITAMLYNAEDLDEDIEAAKCIFRSMRPSAEKETASTGKQAVTIGRASFNVNDDLEVEKLNESAVTVKNAQYTANILWADWDVMLGKDLSTSDDSQNMNCYLFQYLTMGDENSAAVVVSSAQRKDIGMPNGDEVMYIVFGGSAMITYYYPNTGFMIIARHVDNSLTDDELYAIVEEIALSYCLDGEIPQ